MFKLMKTASNIARGRISSTLPKSFVNRFVIRPAGFSSKNLIFVDINPRNIVSWRFCDAETQTLKNVVDLTPVITRNDSMTALYM